MKREISYYAIPGLLTREIPEKIINYIRSKIGYDFLVKNRQDEIVEPRQLAMFLIRKNTDLSLAKIGEKCGNKDHATVLHACKSIQNKLDTRDKKFFKRYSDILINYGIISD